LFACSSNLFGKVEHAADVIVNVTVGYVRVVDVYP